MHPNAQTLTRFYTAFAALDANNMASCYAEDATFKDPVFKLRTQEEVGGMWHMLCAATRARHRQDWQLAFQDVRADDSTGHVHWEAHYRFSGSNRMVHNIIESDFTFTPEGLIASHTDQFDFWRWSRQALGFGGWVLGWAPYFRTLVGRQARAALTGYLAKHAQ
jgi:hypothetical protein